MNSRIVLTAIAAGLVCMPALHAQAPARPAGPWARVPALPTACYTSQDGWSERNNAALAAVQEAHYKQNDVNDGIRQKHTERQSEDPMALAQAMTQAMLNDPQKAQQYMERMTQQGQQAQVEVPAQQERETQLDAEAKTVIKQYEAALVKARAPGEARWSALKKKLELAPEAHHPGEMGVPDWAWKEWDAILREWDRAYSANCATWFGTAGPIHAYMKRYKDHLVQERIPYEKRLMDEPMLEQYRMLEIPMEGWRTTTDYEAAEDYMKRAAEMFSTRLAEPRCKDSGLCY